MTIELPLGPVLIIGPVGSCLSPDAPFRTQFRGYTGMTHEHLYQAFKFHPLDLRTFREILNAPSPHDARLIAREWKKDRNPTFDNEQERIKLWEETAWAKIEQHQYVRTVLIATGSKRIIKNVSDDPFWGWGPDRKGRDEGGKCLMRLRARLTKRH